ncbi:uncharacterized protein K02A2.6-like [Anopheles merus]|uniref:uncharacterized protein K02A2.6-like n=1 Tax=Anopheles merus TaxID=30066 RepID=UPI001BE3EC72|nr:uncharacterized protein K02A2.6-like [Anopheles merus]
MTEDQLKSLVFVCGLREDEDAESRTRLLSRIEEKCDITLEQLSAECQRVANLKKDSAMIADCGERVLAVKSNHQRRYPYQPRNQYEGTSHSHFQSSTNGRRTQQGWENNEKAKYDKPKNPCWLCGELHWMRELNVCQVQKKRKFVTVVINDQPVELQLDTASDITIISQSLWKLLGKPPLANSTVKAKSVSGANLQIDGEFQTDVRIGNTTRQATIRVIDAEHLLLGADLVELFDLGSIPMDAFCNSISTEPVSKVLERKFPAVFNGTGLCTKTCVQLQLKEGVHPVFCPKRPVAYAVQDMVDKELDRLAERGIISPVDYSEWAAPVVVVRKANGNVRLCGDYSTGLNSALRPHEYPLPLPEDIFAKLAHSKLFSKIDLSDAFLQVEVDPRHRPLLTVNTHRGLYTYNRLPPGIKVAPAVFQQLADTMLAGISGVSCYMDDIVIGGSSEQEHDANLSEVLRRIEEYGFTIRAEKCAFKVKQIHYLGYIIDTNGMRPDPAKIEAITRLPEPTDLTGVRSFLGAINYYGKFVPNMRELRYPLDSLLKADTPFRWTKECRQSFNNFKTLLSSNLLLTHYDPKQNIIVSADASSVGLGATLSHEYSDGFIRIVQHASRALTKAEQGYSQIDREGLNMSVVNLLAMPIFFLD